MGEEEPKKVESAETTASSQEDSHNQETAENALSEKESSHSKPPADVEKAPAEKKTEDAIDRDAVLARVVTEKRLALIKAWEESEKTKAENKAHKRLSTIEAWENSKRANVEAKLKEIEEEFEKKKAEYAEKMSNKKAEIHKAAEEKRATIEAKRGEDILKVEEMAAKFRSMGNIPRRLFGCFGF